MTTPDSHRPGRGGPGGPGHAPSIESFVRHSLGCGCPDEVFCSIEIEPRKVAGARIVRLLVGSRLLVYVADARSLLAVPEGLEGVVLEGRSDRERGGFNRFRLVLVGGSAAAAVDDLRDPVPRFAAVVGNDDRLHLHRVAARDLPDCLQPG